MPKNQNCNLRLDRQQQDLFFTKDRRFCVRKVADTVFIVSTLAIFMGRMLKVEVTCLTPQRALRLAITEFKKMARREPNETRQAL